jgi:hypothetical protein
MAKTVVNVEGNDGSVILRGVRVDLVSDIGRAYTADCCRNWEKILPNSAICERYGLSITDWQAMGANKTLVAAVRAEHQRRIKNGTAAQELAAKEFATAPAELGKILRSPNSNPRHVIEAHRELRATAIGTGSETTGGDSSERFTITINLGSDAGADERVIIDAGKLPPRAPDPDAWKGIVDVAEDR